MCYCVQLVLLYLLSRLTNVPAKFVYSENQFLLYGDFTDSYRKMLIRYMMGKSIISYMLFLILMKLFSLFKVCMYYTIVRRQEPGSTAQSQHYTNK